jgi:ABC-type glycerol-3-phosphate transport system permease component
VIVSALIALLAATAVTRFRFRLRTTLLIMFLVAQTAPAEALTIPLFGSTLPMALLVFYRPDDPDWGGVMAASTVMTIPVLVFCVLGQRRLVSGRGGAVKD